MNATALKREQERKSEEGHPSPSMAHFHDRVVVPGTDPLQRAPPPVVTAVPLPEVSVVPPPVPFTVRMPHSYTLYPHFFFAEPACG